VAGLQGIPVPQAAMGDWYRMCDELVEQDLMTDTAADLPLASGIRRKRPGLSTLLSMEALEVCRRINRALISCSQLLFSASAMTDTGSKSFECALVSTMETYDDPENGNYVYYTYYCNYCNYCK
jgi:hypothetical protein